MKNVVEIREVNGDAYPSIKTLINDTPDSYKQIIIDYLKAGKHIAESPSRAVDFITGEPIGFPLSMQGDGMYSWRSDIVYYYEKYNIYLNEDFIKYVIYIYVDDYFLKHDRTECKCSRCGNQIIYEEYGNSYSIECKSENCIKGSSRGI